MEDIKASNTPISEENESMQQLNRFITQRNKTVQLILNAEYFYNSTFMANDVIKLVREINFNWTIIKGLISNMESEGTYCKSSMVEILHIPSTIEGIDAVIALHQTISNNAIEFMEEKMTDSLSGEHRKYHMWETIIANYFVQVQIFIKFLNTIRTQIIEPISNAVIMPQLIDAMELAEEY